MVKINVDKGKNDNSKGFVERAGEISLFRQPSAGFPISILHI